jgi:hypothetical protein
LHPLDPAWIGSGVADADEQITLNAADDRRVLYLFVHVVLIVSISIKRISFLFFPPDILLL